MKPENEVIDDAQAYFLEVTLKMREMDKAGRITLITSVLDRYVRRVVTNKVTHADKTTVNAHLMNIIVDSLPQEVLEADGFPENVGSVVGTVLDALGMSGVKTVEKCSGYEGELVSKRSAQAVLEKIISLLGATQHLKFEYGIAHSLMMQKFTKLYPEGLEQQECETFLWEEVKFNMEMLLSDREE